MSASLDDYRWLTGPSARPWLARAAEELSAGEPLVRLATKFRRELSAERTHLALAQAELRQRARDKFSRADEMFFTPLCLAQATDEPLAQFKAARFPAAAKVVDFCCGIGGDLLGLSDGRICLGIDRDPIAAHLAAANAVICGRTSLRVECREVATELPADCEAWHIDPDRRPGGKRTVQADRFEPSWEMVEALLGSCGVAAVKLAPATKLAADVAGRCEREWIESRGECRQQVAWFGRLARHAGKCAATKIDAAGGPVTIVGNFDEPAPVAGGVGHYVYDPCAAVLAARLTGSLCRQTGLAGLAGGPSYLTSDERIEHPLVAGFEVLEALPFDVRRLTGALRRLGVTPAEVKKRGVDFDPEQLRRQLTIGDGQAGAVLIGPVGVRAMAIVARRLVSPT